MHGNLVLFGGDVNFDAFREQINSLLLLQSPDVIVDTLRILLSSSLSIVIRVHGVGDQLGFNHRYEYPANIIKDIKITNYVQRQILI